MSWVKLDNGLYDHPKALQAGNEAIGVFCRSLAYAGRQLTDGFIPAGVASFLGGHKPIAALVEAGFWEEVHGGFQVHDYLHYQRSRDDVERDRAGARERMRARRVDQ